MVLLTSFPPPEEGIVHKEEAIEAYINTKSIGRGSLYIAESRVSWRNDSGEGFSLEYPAISLHAISRDQSSFPHQCLYLMVEAKLDQDEGEGNESSDSAGTGDSASGSQISELRFVPENTLTLESMYKAMCDCQVLHPDEEDTDSENDMYGNEQGQGDFYSNQADVDQLTAGGQQTLQRLDQMLGVADNEAGEEEERDAHQQSNGDGTMETGDAEQFEDADMDT